MSIVAKWWMDDGQDHISMRNTHRTTGMLDHVTVASSSKEIVAV